MARFEFRLHSSAIVSALQNEANDYVNHVWSDRRDQCLEAIGEVLDENGYLPEGTTWEVFGMLLQFSTYTDYSDEDLAHYFFEGQVYGPNFPKWDEYQKERGKNGKWRYVRDAKGNKVGLGEPSKYVTPSGYVKYPKRGQYLNGQEPGSSIGVRHWTDAVMPNGELFEEVCERCEEILRR